ncbi:MAG: hypothetical protein IJY64_00205 [Bacteroidaceae bacterium]|nr:hypothetical protein [Bacteroidaceae bacterium]
MKKLNYLLILAVSILPVACSDDDNENLPSAPVVELPEWYYTGGQLGTTHLATFNAFEQPTASVENEGMYQSFKNGEALFEKPFMSNNEGVRHGLGPVYIRTSCLHCHPGYGHGKRINAGMFNTNEIGNGNLLVVYNKDTEGYVSWLAGMPQGHAVAPFKAPIDESKIIVEWLDYTDEWGNKFPDGETYELQYPQVKMPSEAFYVYNQCYDKLGNFGVKLESTIGIYGTGLLDAIPDEDIVAEWKKQEQDGYMPNGLNKAYFENGEWKSFYANTAQGGDGTKYIRRYTYAMSRGPLQDGAGANAFWNITNATRSDRRFHYLDAAGTYALYSSKDPDVQEGFEEYIAAVDPKREYPEFWNGTVEERIYAYLTSKNLPIEVTDEEYTDLMVWHRGLAVPAARNVDDIDVLRGRELFEEIGCAYCHRPSWTTGEDVVRDPARFFSGNELPRYPKQKIWPYTDMVQHKLCMENDIRTGWCRTTPLWGRGLHQKVTGSATADRLHDCRARTTMEAIMWHGNEKSDARRSVEEFRKLSKEERDAIIKFIDAI